MCKKIDTISTTIIVLATKRLMLVEYNRLNKSELTCSQGRRTDYQLLPMRGLQRKREVEVARDGLGESEEGVQTGLRPRD